MTASKNAPSRVLHIMPAKAAERNPHSLPGKLSLSSEMPGTFGSLPLSSLKQWLIPSTSHQWRTVLCAHDYIYESHLDATSPYPHITSDVGPNTSASLPATMAARSTVPVTPETLAPAAPTATPYTS